MPTPSVSPRATVDVMMPLIRDWDFDVLLTHNRFTLINRNAERDDRPRAVERGMAVLERRALWRRRPRQGHGARHRATPTRRARRTCSSRSAQIEAICARHGIPAGAAALQFSMRDPRITATVCGVTKPERVPQTLEWAQQSDPGCGRGTSCWPVPSHAESRAPMRRRPRLGRLEPYVRRARRSTSRIAARCR